MSVVSHGQRRKSSDKPFSLGPAPQDIYQLDQEIRHITQANVPSRFTQFQVTQATHAIQDGKSVEIQLSPDITPKQLLKLIKALGFENYKLIKLFRDSSIVVKNLIDSYVKSLHKKYQTVLNLSQEYENENDYLSHSNALGYLFHTKQVTPLQCNESDLTAKVRISMNLNFENTVENDAKFIGQFRNELAQNVFKCDARNINVLNVREGSVVVVIGGISLIALAFVGIITLAVALRYNSNLQENRKSKVSAYKDMNDNIVNMRHQQQNDSKNEQLASGNSSSVNEKDELCKDEKNSKQEKQKEKVQEKRLSLFGRKKSETQAQSAVTGNNFVSSLFSKIKGGIDQMAPPLTKKDKERDDGDKGKEIAVNDASIGVQEYSEEAKAAVTMNETKQSDEASDISIDYNSIGSVNSIYSSSSYVDDSRELLRLNIDDCIWVRGKNNNKLYAATVIGLTRNTCTIEYDNKPFTFINTETFQLDDARLSLREPGFNDDKFGNIEGRVEIDSKIGGFIRIFQNNENNESSIDNMGKGGGPDNASHYGGFHFGLRDRPTADI